jgi:hypothetical protein
MVFADRRLSTNEQKSRNMMGPSASKENVVKAFT